MHFSAFHYTGSLSRDQLVVEEVDVDPQFDSLVEINNWDEQNNSWVYNFSSSLEMAVRSMQPSCGMSDELELQVVALTSPFDAVVSSPASLSVFYGTYQTSYSWCMYMGKMYAHLMGSSSLPVYQVS